MSEGPVRHVDVLGVLVSAIDMSTALAVFDGWVDGGERHYVCVSGVHGVMESLRDPALRAVHNAAGLVTPDGMPLVWLGRLAGHRQISRVYGPDLMLAYCAHGLALRRRHFFCGGNDGVPELLAERLGARFPGLQVVGAYSPPFGACGPEEDAEIARRINETSPDIVWVGLSTPKQERWMAAYRPVLNAPVLVGVGAAFDFNAGLKRQAPRWMQRGGLEWAFRLATEPRRLGRRYLANNPSFVWHVAMQMLGIGHYDGTAGRDAASVPSPASHQRGRSASTLRWRGAHGEPPEPEKTS